MNHQTPTPTASILEWPHPKLRNPASSVTTFDERLRDQVAIMWSTMYQAPGIGLAAPQIGDARCIFVMDCTPRYEAARRFVCINPELTELCGVVDSSEGCLSFPGLSVTVPRAKHLTLRAQDEHGAWFEVKLNGLEAICAQHEYDHLVGRSFLDLLSPLDQLSALHNYAEGLSELRSAESAQIRARLNPLLAEILEQTSTHS